MTNRSQSSISTFDKSRLIDADIDYAELIQSMEIEDTDSFGILMEKCEYALSELGCTLDQIALECLSAIIFQNVEYLTEAPSEEVSQFFEQFLSAEDGDEVIPKADDQNFESGNLGYRHSSLSISDIFGT
jgi:hypothetical protein